MSSKNVVMKDIEKLEENLGYTFENKELLQRALTHASCCT